MSRTSEIHAELRPQLPAHRPTVSICSSDSGWPVILASVMTPFTYTGRCPRDPLTSAHSVWRGSTLPIALVIFRPPVGTRQTIAVVQMMWSAVFIMIGGRIETHFTSSDRWLLAFTRLEAYPPPRWSWRSITWHVACSGQRAYGVNNPERWRFLSTPAGSRRRRRARVRASWRRRAARPRITSRRPRSSHPRSNARSSPVRALNSEGRYRALVENIRPCRSSTTARTARWPTSGRRRRDPVGRSQRERAVRRCRSRRRSRTRSPRARCSAAGDVADSSSTSGPRPDTPPRPPARFLSASTEGRIHASRSTSRSRRSSRRSCARPRSSSPWPTCRRRCPRDQHADAVRERQRQFIQTALSPTS